MVPGGGGQGDAVRQASTDGKAGLTHSVNMGGIFMSQASDVSGKHRDAETDVTRPSRSSPPAGDHTWGNRAEAEPWRRGLEET